MATSKNLFYVSGQLYSPKCYAESKYAVLSGVEVCYAAVIERSRNQRSRSTLCCDGCGSAAEVSAAEVEHSQRYATEI
jgi:hypothetical protein